MQSEALRQILHLDYAPKLPQDKTKGIGIVGAGEIVKTCHLPAYRMAGFNVVGVFDSDLGRAEALARQFGIPKSYRSLEELLSDRSVQFADIAVPAKYQPRIAAEAAAAGKHVLCQKPLAEQYAEAAALVTAFSKAGVKGAVNQQMRWAPSMGASRTIVSRGWIGEPVQASIQVNVRTQWEQWEWLTRMETLEIMYHSLHYLDAIRYVLGLVPESIYADGARFPGQPYVGETRTLLHIKFPGEARGLVFDSHNNRQPQDDWFATFRFEGTEGVVKGTNGALYNYPVGREDTLSFYSERLAAGYLFTPALEGRWFPHAFMGPMSELMLSVEENREPSNSLRDNLTTLKMVFAAYRSMEENRAVRLAEIE
ncbi:Gfo/Idh/MocA family oxidoreductase [Paenibacillus sp.]|uniref:Gfo/Idh/MocA family protein n=1 Tax=Paenibacillus sp. TaxID=58172 RepID=UPI002D3289E3|nr:Gfo/Idh/MocA family oxidoreductase [Paenibacillus sp.]HZG87921.1 Gfo/Idh/MocA family oxidoreductase [Paenibacillus sp.]